MLLLACVALAATAVVAQVDAPIIRKADVSADETQLIISGRGFCLNPVVKLSTISLDVASVDLDSPQVIVANLPAHIDPAGYRYRWTAASTAGAMASSATCSSAQRVDSLQWRAHPGPTARTGQMEPQGRPERPGRPALPDPSGRLDLPEQLVASQRLSRPANVFAHVAFGMGDTATASCGALGDIIGFAVEGYAPAMQCAAPEIPVIAGVTVTQNSLTFDTAAGSTAEYTLMTGGAGACVRVRPICSPN